MCSALKAGRAIALGLSSDWIDRFRHRVGAEVVRMYNWATAQGIDSMIFVCGMRRLLANGEPLNRLCRPYRNGGGREAGAAASEVTNRMLET